MIHFRASVSTEDLNTFGLFEHDTDLDSYDDQAGATVPDPRSR